MSINHKIYSLLYEEDVYCLIEHPEKIEDFTKLFCILKVLLGCGSSDKETSENRAYCIRLTFAWLSKNKWFLEEHDQFYNEVKEKLRQFRNSSNSTEREIGMSYSFLICRKAKYIRMRNPKIYKWVHI